jgi:hypothetical protein
VRVFTGGTTSDEEGFVGAWNLDGEPEWSMLIDPLALGLEETWGEVVDVDALPDGDVVVAYNNGGDARPAVFLRLDGETGDVVWSTVLDAEFMAAFEPQFGGYGGEAQAVAITASGRVFIVAAALLTFTQLYFLGELDESSGELLWTSEIITYDQTATLYTRQFFADDDSGLFHRSMTGWFGGGGQASFGRYGLDGEIITGLGADDSQVLAAALAPDGTLGMASASVVAVGVEPDYFLERRDVDDTLLFGGPGEPPEIPADHVAFQSDGDMLLIAYPLSIQKLDAAHEVLSLDPITGLTAGIAVLPDGDLVRAGSASGDGLLERYVDCE